MSRFFSGTLTDVIAGRTFRGSFTVEDGRIVSINEDPQATGTATYIPGLVDAHVHVESSMLPPSEFARACVLHGTVATVSDPHEIANVLGLEGVRWMVENGQRVPVKFSFGAPSCVPATPFEAAGTSFAAKEVGVLLDTPGVDYLAEVMNFPAVIHRDPAIMAIVGEARRRGLRIDGHAPGLRGDDLHQYIAAGIETDHESFTLEEAREKAAKGMKIALREGSAARNFDALWPILKEFPDACFFCSDDKHPDDLLHGHINLLVARAIFHGIDPMTALRVATRNPVQHYRLPVGLLQVGDPADFTEVDSLETMRVRRTWIDGRLVAENGQTKLPPLPVDTPNHFREGKVEASDFHFPAPKGETLPVIEALDGQIVTGRQDLAPKVAENQVQPDLARDLLLLTVVNRYQKAHPAMALVQNFGLREGALASSVAHDSHNIVAVGTSCESLARAVNLIFQNRGGLAAVTQDDEKVLPLPIAGLMSDRETGEVAATYEQLNRLAHTAGCRLKAPYMLLSFLALLVIPRLKLGDRGLFDVEKFAFVEA